MPELKFCNCAKCGLELLGDSLRDWFCRELTDEQRDAHPWPVAGRHRGRPYCVECFDAVRLGEKLREQTV